MTTAAAPTTTVRLPAAPSRRRRRAGWSSSLSAVVATAAAVTAVVVGTRVRDGRPAPRLPRRRRLAGHRSGRLPRRRAPCRSGPHQHPAPIASLAKVMTAYLVLQAHPLPGRGDGPAPAARRGATCATTSAAGPRRVGGARWPPASGSPSGRRCWRCCCRRPTTSPICWRAGRPAAWRSSWRG